MNYYSDPTASEALRNLNREFSKKERKAKRLRQLYEEGRLSEKALEKAHSQFTGIYRHVLANVMKEEQK